MKNLVVIALVWFIGTNISLATEPEKVMPVEFVGFVVDAQTHEPLEGVQLSLSVQGGNIYTDANGMFRVQAIPNTELSIRYISYQSQQVHLQGAGAAPVMIYLSELD